MATLTDGDLKRILPLADTARWIEPLNTCLEEFGINSPLRIAAFLAQVATESGSLNRLVENLNYSAAGLKRTWPKRFPSDELARQFERQPERIANFVYGGRMGNGSEQSGDGWRFRGRGLLQVTGRSNYRTVGAGLGLALEAQPELLEIPLNAARSAGLYWRSHGLNELADVSGDLVHDDEDFITITTKINGGTTGLTERIAFWTTAKTVLGV